MADGDWGAGIRTVGPGLGPCELPAAGVLGLRRTDDIPSIADEIHLKDAEKG